MVGVFLASNLIGGIQYDSNGAVIAVVLILSFFNMVLRPLLILFALPFVIMTLGVGILVINALLFLLAGKFVPGFHVESFWAAFWGAALVGLTNLIANVVLGTSKVNIQVNQEGMPQPEQTKQEKIKSDDDVIDI